jgi:hypothetical protein
LSAARVIRRATAFISSPFAFEVAEGGYAVKMADGQVQQVYGEKFAAWKKPGNEHEPSRLARRAH